MSGKTDIFVRAGTTLNIGFRFTENPDTPDEKVLTNTDILSVKFKIRSSDNRMTDEIPLVYDDGVWRLSISANLTETYPTHRALYWAADAVLASGDTVCMDQGNLRASAIGGVL